MAKASSLAPLKRYGFKVVLAPIFKLFECICELFVPYIVKQIIDKELPAGNNQNCLYLSLVILALACAGFGVTMITQYLAARVSTDFGYDLKKELYAHLNRISKGQLERFGESKALTLINNDSFALQTGVNMIMRLLIRGPALLVGTVIMSFLLVDVYAGFTVLAVLALSGIAVTVVLLLSPKRYKAIQEELDHLSTIGNDSLTGARVIRAFNKQEDESKKFEDSSLKYRRRAFALSRLNAILNPLTFAFVNLGVLLVLYLSSYKGSDSTITIGGVVMVINYLATALAALMMFSRLITSASKAAASKKRLDEFLSIEPDIVDGELDAKEMVDGEPLFELRNVSLSFGGEEYAIKDIDFKVNVGETIGIIGGTGSGKSTLISLLERFMDASKGEVFYMGESIKDYKLKAIRGNIALVSQKPQLFQGTIKSNVTLGNPNADEATIEEALKDSLAYEYVSRYQDGINHEVRENGANLSGGQKQRLLIARALCSKRPILILDDSTSALDYRSDATLRANLKKNKNLTTILVSQRATSIKDSDRIYVLDEGRVVAVGKHEELLSSCSIYKEIYETQVAVK